MPYKSESEPMMEKLTLENLKILIVDDEEPAREEMRWLLESCGTSCIFTANSTEEAIKLFEGNHFDLLFCDIRMPGANGLRFAEIVRSIAGSDTEIVFVTAYSDHAVEAFAVEAIDYLVKPVRLERLREALQRALTRRRSYRLLKQQKERRIKDEHSEYLTRISVEDKGVYHVVPIEQVVYFESDNGAVHVLTTNGKFKTDFSLKGLQTHLNPRHFFRCHRSYIVQLANIRAVIPSGTGTYNLHIEGSPIIIPLARSRTQSLKLLMPWTTSGLNKSGNDE